MCALEHFLLRVSFEASNALHQRDVEAVEQRPCQTSITHVRLVPGPQPTYHMNLEQPEAGSRSWWKRPLRLIFVVVTLLAVLVALLPYALLGVAKKQISEVMTNELGTPCRIDELRFGWLSGFDVEGVEIGNPPGFDSADPVIRLASAHVEVALLPLLRGQVGIDAEVRGLHLRIDENEDGTTNIEHLARMAMMQLGAEVSSDSGRDVSDEPEAPAGSRSRKSPASTTVDSNGTEDVFFKSRVHVALFDSSIELRREGEVLESLLDLDAAVDKDPRTTEVRVRFGAVLPAHGEGDPHGSVAIDGELDVAEETGRLRFRAKSLDLGRYRSMVATRFDTEAIAELEGVIDGQCEVQFDSRNGAMHTSSGDLAIRDLHLQGALFAGYEVRAASLHLRPVASMPSRFAAAKFAEVETLLSASSFDFGFDGADLTIAHEGKALGSFDTVKCAVSKGAGSQRLRVQLETEGTTGDGQASSLLCTAELDSKTKRGRGILKARGLDLSQYRPLLALDDAELSAMRGMLDSDLDLELDFGSARSIDINGELAIAGPHFAGTALQGADLKADRWTLKPSLRFLLPDVDGKPRLELGKTSADLGFAQLQSLDEAARKERDIDTAGACTFATDFAALARLGGPFAELAGLTGTTTGVLVLPTELLRGEIELGLQQWKNLHGIRADADLQAVGYAAAGLVLTDATAKATVRDGIIAIVSEANTALNQGPVQLQLRADANQPNMPFEFTMNWKDGKVRGDSKPLLRYFVPLLAGVGADSADFRGVVDLRVAVRGTALRQEGENALQWLERWQGGGEIVVDNGSIVPAAGLGELLSLLGQPQQLAIDRFSSSFVLQQGAIAHRATRWISKGADYGLQGKVHLDGGLELGLDVTSLLKQHKDGAVIAGFLARKPLLAEIRGTLDEPVFRGPDLGKLVQDALQAAPRQLLEQQGRDMLQRGLDQLFGDKPKKKQ